MDKIKLNSIDKILICLLFLFLGCNKNNEYCTNKYTEKINTHIDYDSIRIVFKNKYFFVDLKTGSIENHNMEIGNIKLNNQDKIKIKESFYENLIYSFNGEIHIFNHENITSITNDEIINIEKDGVIQSVFFIEKDLKINEINSNREKKIVLFYNDIKKILLKSPFYIDLYHKEKNNDKSIKL